MATAAVVPGRRIACDAAAGKLVVEPLRRVLLGFLPLVAVTPLALAWSLTHGSRLTTAGWVLMIAYAIAALLLALRVVTAMPPVLVDFEAKKLFIGRDGFAFADVKVETKAEKQRALTTLRTPAREVVLFDLAGPGAAIPPAFDKAMRGEGIADLEHQIGLLGSEHLKALIMRLVLLVAPGLMFAYAAIF